MFFRRKPSPAQGAAPLTRAQSFAARPIAVKVSKREPLNNGGVRLTIPYAPTKAQRLLLRIPEHAQRRVDLDAVGANVFDMCDGKTSVKEISRRLAREHQVDPRETDAAVVAFIRMMMRKRMVVIGVPHDA